MLIDIMHTITNALQVPVIVLLMALAVLMVVIMGMLLAEFFTERRYFRLSVPELVDNLQSSPDPEAVIRESGMLRRQKTALFELLSHPLATPSERESMAVNIVAQEQAIFDNRVKVTDFIAKVGPMLGLMGTLIPLGPGVIAIGAGDTETLSVSLLVAFDTTIMGLVVAALALLVSTIRKSWYTKYNAAFEAACEVVLEKANEGASLARPAAQPFSEGVTQPLPVAAVSSAGGSTAFATESMQSRPAETAQQIPAAGPVALGFSGETLASSAAGAMQPLPTEERQSFAAKDLQHFPEEGAPAYADGVSGEFLNADGASANDEERNHD